MDLNKTFNEVIVVEGYHDLDRIRKIYPNADIEITNGSEIGDELLQRLLLLSKTRGLILFLDADYQGERIRNIITTYVGETKHAFLKKKDSISKNKRKIGVEHAKNEKIIEALSNCLTYNDERSKQISMGDLNKLKLIGQKESKIIRGKLCDKLGIGLSNGKTLLRRLNAFGISLSKIQEILEGELVERSK